MSINKIYRSVPGRAFIILMQKAGLFSLAGFFLRTGISKRLIPGYIKKHKIDMSDFRSQKYESFAEFFARKRETSNYILNPDILISPCDGQLSIYPITDNLNIAMKGSRYRVADLVPDDAAAARLGGGLCLVFRLQASDYHHFCAFDNMTVKKTQYIPGVLHSVQPIACEKEPVYRLNRRWWSLLNTMHFGEAVQIEIGAMLVGDVRFEKKSGWLYRGDEMGHFELSGSTIVIMLSPNVSRQLYFGSEFDDALYGVREIPVRMGKKIGVLRNVEKNGIN